jgi:hypothetical protein
MGFVGTEISLSACRVEVERAWKAVETMLRCGSHFPPPLANVSHQAGPVLWGD